MKRALKFKRQIMPDWRAIFTGVATSMAMLELLGSINLALGLLRLDATDSLMGLVSKLAWLFGSMTALNYTAGFVTGLVFPRTDRIAAARNSFIVNGLTVVLFFVLSWAGFNIVQGVGFAEGMIWWATMLTPNNMLAVAYGAIHGNEYLPRYVPRHENVFLLRGKLAVPVAQRAHLAFRDTDEGLSVARIALTLGVLAAAPLFLGWVGSFVSPLIMVLISVGLLVAFGMRIFGSLQPRKAGRQTSKTVEPPRTRRYG